MKLRGWVAARASGAGPETTGMSVPMGRTAGGETAAGIPVWSGAAGGAAIAGDRVPAIGTSTGQVAPVAADGPAVSSDAADCRGAGKRVRADRSGSAAALVVAAPV
jgi:hypothetical protein